MTVMMYSLKITVSKAPHKSKGNMSHSQSLISLNYYIFMPTCGWMVPDH